MDKGSLKNLIKLRRLLHSEPELSGREQKTSQTILNFISNFVSFISQKFISTFHRIFFSLIKTLKILIL